MICCDVTQIVVALLQKSGATEWNNAEARAQLIAAANEIIEGIGTMALPDYVRLENATAKVFRNSGGDAAITLASLANGNGTTAGARQSVKLDLGATRAKRYRVKATFEIAATPTAGNVIDLYWSPSSSATAGTDNAGGASGADAAYTGYSSNNLASLKQCIYIGSFICTAQATATVQQAFVGGTFTPPERYGSLIVYNASGAALHNTETNQAITLIPDNDKIEDT